MRSRAFLATNSLVRAISGGAAAAACLLGLDGCAASSDAQTANGGNGGTRAMTGAAGTTSFAGSAGTGGAAAGASLVVDCGGLSYVEILGTDCATPGCHRGTPEQTPSRLVLTPDAGLVSRLKDVAAKHLDIFCLDQDMFCTPAVCDPSVLLVNSASPDKSWILAKLRGTQNGCGDRMPSDTYDPQKQQCLEKMVMAIAALPKQ